MNQSIGERIQLTEERWQAILRNDPAFDLHFYYGVQSTGIFCRPSCKSRPPKKQNVRIFLNAAQALSESFRPCKRCKPDGTQLPAEEWVDQITEYIDRHYVNAITLDTLADLCHGSPYHLQRTFRRVKGMTPAEYIQRKRITAAKEYLLRTDKSLNDIALAVGFASTSYFATLFKRMTEQTPSHYRRLGSNKPNTGGQMQEQPLIPMSINGL
ncbi:MULTISPECIES: bifunctional transcriptional activator/DNA repair enzyme AdaA [Paenibacillus]|uniref:bifunctional transcriptional activator/DNA repair enzyme AdaA n=1 Tax=Paenibacillus TaxID=44249 RepID=UPI0022B8E108|nr:bifunctional transcriptional activator/DNA repair enzyme AdaA [Paenibacillus caseinilyticus]MCZ8519409.1 bifunctional transcriptional activator/DNA repair enzyme AdaA [Paenibacillus caseinilyticus]